MSFVEANGCLDIYIWNIFRIYRLKILWCICRYVYTAIKVRKNLFIKFSYSKNK